MEYSAIVPTTHPSDTLAPPYTASKNTPMGKTLSYGISQHSSDLMMVRTPESLQNITSSSFMPGTRPNNKAYQRNQVAKR